MLNLTPIVSTAIRAAMHAGAEILDVYCQETVAVENKADHSPVTIADYRAHVVIDALLRETDIPIISEEGFLAPYEERQSWQYVWIVDPLDGTKEFIAKTNEFCVNIALVKDGEPILGVIYSPVADDIWFGLVGEGTYKIEQASVSIEDFSFPSLVQIAVHLPYYQNHDTFVVVASSSHFDEATKSFIETLKQEYATVDITQIGSALKFCLLAEGKASLYPRFTPTSEWDTAAGDALIRAIGGIVTQANTNIPLVYNKPDFINPGFVAFVK